MARKLVDKYGNEILGPQPGAQTLFVTSPADIVIYGGGAFTGKSYLGTLEATRNVGDPLYSAGLFRKQSVEIMMAGGLWDTASRIFPSVGGVPNLGHYYWKFPSGSRIEYHHITNESVIYTYQGSAFVYLMFDELTHFCLTPDHEVLTNNGWKNIASIKVGDVVASLSKEETIEYKTVDDVHAYNHNGDMYECNERNGLSFCGTDNHEMIVRRQDKNKSIGKKRLDSWGNDKVVRTGNKVDGYEIKEFNIPVPQGRGHGSNKNSFEKIDGDAYLQFLGFYIAEGCSFRMKSRSRSPVVSIRQTKEDGKVFIREVLSRLPWRYTETKDGQFKIFSRQLYNCVNWMGDLYTKRVPRWIYGLTKRQIKLFVDAFVEGDGYKAKKGAIQIGLANDGLIDDFQELFFLLGRVATKRSGVNKKGFKYYSLYVSKEARRDTRVINEHINKINYQGTVHCLTVRDNHNFLCRRNGKYFFSGNSEKEFFYLLSRNRPPTGCKLKPYCRATCNPEPGWVANLIQWWWDPNTGYAIPERSGVIRHFVREGDDIVWVSPDYRDKDGDPPKSITFIAATLDDNPIGTEADPTYRANLKTQDYVTRERLLKGNWLIDYGGNMFKPEWLPVVDEIPDGIKLVRYWDFAASEVKEKDKDDPDWTAGALCGIYEGILYIVDVTFFRESPGKTEVKVLDTAQTDGRQVEVWWEEEKASAGKFTSEYMKQVLKGFDAHPDPVSGHKVERARPWSAWAEQGKVRLLRGEWNRQFKSWASKFPSGKRDTIDAVSGCFKVLTGPSRVFKYYISDAKHNLRVFEKEKEDFEKIQPHNIDVYLTLWAEEDGGIFGCCWAWSKLSKKLRMYNEIVHYEPIPGILASDIVEKVVVPMYDKPNFVSLKAIYCNDVLLSPGKHHMAKELRKFGIRPRTLKVYDEVGSILTLNRMMAQRAFIVHPDCQESDSQIRGWMYKDKKIEKGYPLARNACLIVSQLRSEMRTVDLSLAKPYSAKKEQVRQSLKATGDIPGNLTGKRNQYDYLAK